MDWSQVLQQPSGVPDIKLGPLSMWVLDGSRYEGWLNVRLQVATRSAVVQAEGEILRRDEIATLIAGSRWLYDKLSGRVEMRGLEPNLAIAMEIDGQGHISVEVDLTGDVMTQRHHFEFELDQTYLPEIIQACEKVLTKYPTQTPRNQWYGG